MATTASGLTPAQLAAFRRDGFLVIESFWDESTVSSVKRATDDLLSSFSPPATASVFTTEEQERTADSYFLDSGDFPHLNVFQDEHPESLLSMDVPEPPMALQGQAAVDYLVLMKRTVRGWSMSA